MLHGLKRRIAGLLCSNKVAALFMKAAKSCSSAEELCHKVQELEQLIESRWDVNLCMFAGQWHNIFVCIIYCLCSTLMCTVMHRPVLYRHLICQVSLLFFSKQNNSSLSNDRGRLSKLAHIPPQALKHLWIRTALMEKLLDKIVVYLVENSGYCYASFNATRSYTGYRRLYPAFHNIMLLYFSSTTDSPLAHICHIFVVTAMIWKQ